LYSEGVDENGTNSEQYFIEVHKIVVALSRLHQRALLTPGTDPRLCVSSKQSGGYISFFFFKLSSFFHTFRHCSFEQCALKYSLYPSLLKLQYKNVVQSTV